MVCIIPAVREAVGEITVDDMHMIAYIHRIILNLEFMSKLLKEKIE